MIAPASLLTDPLKFAALGWPHLKLYDKQVDVLYSVMNNDETYVPAGNQLGKDFIAGFASLWFFCSRMPVRVVTSSVDAKQLEGVLWGEIRRFLQTCEIKLPIQVNHCLLRHILPNGELEPLSYLMGRVSAKDEGMLGHHVAKTDDGRPRTLAVFDEASGIDDLAYQATDTWAHRRLIIGNPKPCTNFFFKGVKEGRVASPTPGRLYREVIRIKAVDSPNVKVPLEREAKGLPWTNEIFIPGLKDYDTYKKHRALLDPVRAAWVLDGEFYEGAETLLFPFQWLDRAEDLYKQLNPRRAARTMGVDPAEGGDDTVWTIVDHMGLIYWEAKKTSDTAVIPERTVAIMRQFNIKPENVFFDSGGGGKQHVDQLARKGYRVRTVGFGEAATPPAKRRSRFISQSAWQVEKEVKYTYKNRRAEMYGTLREMLDPATNPKGFALPPNAIELRKQLSILPLLYDGEGRLWLPPKNRKDENSTTTTLRDILGRSPDEADSLVLAVYGLTVKPLKMKVGAV